MKKIRANKVRKPVHPKLTRKTKVWVTRDMKEIAPEDMAPEHCVNVIRMFTRLVIRRTDSAYYYTAEAICSHFPLLARMAQKARAGGLDPFKDYGGVLSQPNCDVDYSLEEVVKLKGE